MTDPSPGLLEQVRSALGAQYEIERELGAGGMGSVFLARDLTLDRRVAIKVIAPELGAAKAFRSRFLQEARTVARLRHPNIVAVHAAGEADGLLYFVMEYVPGESIRGLLEREGRVAPAHALRILRQLADALSTAHANGIIHRDIKPENILLDAESGRAMITDFGVAQALSSGDERMTGTGFIVGSPRYMSPEQAAGERNLDGRSDIYSLGLVGYEMVAGEPAFGGESAVSIIAQQITAPAPALSDKVEGLPPALDEAITRALAKDPAARWPDAPAMAAALGEPSGEMARGTPLLHRSRSRRTWMMAGAVAAVVVAALVAVTTLTGGDGPPKGVDPRKSFLIVPFENQTGDPQLAWLREGSVNMLTLNLSEWRDLSVVDYERTLDLIEQEELGDGRIGLDEARRLARKAGVWTAVLGTVMRGDSLVVTARVYDIATGRPVDDARASAPLGTDPRVMFDQLSRQLLDLADAPTLVIDHARKTSTSLEAYRAYLAGVRALNSFDLDSADAALGRAIAADSTFALAYYKRALLHGWQKTLGDTSDIHFSRLAARHAGRLPERERMLVDAHLALSEGIQASMMGEREAATRFLRDAQAKYTALTRRDSMDAEVWYGLGDAYFHEPANDEPYVRLMQHAMRAFQRTLTLDSTLHLAYPHLLTVYTVSGNQNAPIMLRGDSLVFLDAAARQRLGAPAIDSARREARERARATAQHWVIHDPSAREAHEALANAHVVAKDYASAASTLRTALARRDVQAPEFPYRIATYELYAGRPQDALSTLRAAATSESFEQLREHGSASRMTTVFSSATVAAYLGKPSLLDSLRTIAVQLDPQLPGGLVGAASTSTAVFLDPWVALAKAALGMDYDKLRAPIDAVARNFDPSRPGVPQQARQSNAMLMYAAFVISRDTMYYDALRRWSVTPQAEPPEFQALLAIARGDTAAARAAAGRLDRGEGPPGPNLFSAFLRGEALAEIGDLRGAIAAYESIDPSSMTQLQGVPDFRWALYARTHLARGQMYEELGERAKAEAAYQQFVDLWRDADPELQSQVAAARAGLSRLRDRPTT
jgi:eukaryotic-like serine/threonine-protein kinase